MNTADLLLKLREVGVQLRLEEGKLKYTAPAGAMTTDLLSALKEKKQDIIELLSEAAEEEVELLTLSEEERKKPLPLSFAQERMWRFYLIEPDSPAYNISMAVHIDGSRDHMGIMPAVKEIIARHETLRTGFHAENGVPVQIIESSVPVNFTLEDASGLGAEERGKRQKNWLVEETERPFVLSTPPLMRVNVLKLAEDQFSLILVMHHIVSDGWSVGVLLRELLAVHEAMGSQGNLKGLKLPEMNIQFADYVIWQRKLLQGSYRERRLNFWKGMLGVDVPILHFPVDYLRGASQSYRGALTKFEVSKSLTGALRVLAEEAKTTLFTVFFSAFQVLLARYSGQEEFIIGLPAANRERAELQNLIGFFVHVLPLRMRVDENLNFRQLLDETGNVAREAFSNQDMPLDLIMEETSIRREVGYNPVYQVIFNYLQNEELDVAFSDIKISSLELENPPVRTDFDLYLFEKEEVLSGQFVYNEDLFDQETIERAGERYLQILTEVVENPERPLRELPVKLVEPASFPSAPVSFVKVRGCEDLSWGTYEAELFYWRYALRGDVQALSLAVTGAYSDKDANKEALLDFKLDSDLLEELKKLAGELDVSARHILAGVFTVLLHGYSSQKDIIIGTNSSPDNYMALRSGLDGEREFIEVLKGLASDFTEALAFGVVPFSILLERLGLLAPSEGGGQENTGSGEFLKVFFNYGPRISLGKYELVLSAEESAGGFIFAILYDESLFTTNFINRMQRHFLTLLKNLLDNPHQRILEITYISDSERDLLLQKSKTEREYPGQKAVHVLFESHVSSNSEGEALRWSSGSLSYKELNIRANRLAHYLRKSGVSLETPVGICMLRSSQMLVGILGILKAGGAYVPLDPDYPQDRLSYMVEDAGISHVLSTGEFKSKIKLDNVRLILVDRDEHEIAGESDANLEPVSTGENLAYIMYTSGSTGLPKGTSILHKAVNRLVCNPDYVEYDGKDRVAHMASISFDAATFEIWGAFANGGTLIIYDKELVLTPREFGEALGRDRISHIFLTSALFNQMVKLAPGFCSELGFVMVGGEAVSPESMRQVLAAGGPRKLLNGYGPTENTTFSVSFHIAEVAPDAGSVPIGRPIANSTAYILDQNLCLLPVGVPGTLYVGGEGLARHYHNRPELTAEKFIPNPYSGTPGARMYDTGDLAYWTEEGSIEFLGRLDDQVKIRGFRIETGEIEAVLERHPELSRATVLVREDEPGMKRLVAYVIKREAPGISNDELRSYLGETLPDYMVPTAMVVLKEFPLTVNGKLDHRALPAPELSSGVYIAPRTKEERVLAEIWEDVLKVERVGLTDNFFELGGDSILSIQIMSRAGTQGIHLTTRQIFKHQNIELLAAAAEERLIAGAEQGPVTGEMPLTPVQKWFFAQKLTEPNHFNQSSLLELPADLEVKQLEAALTKLSLHHDMLRARFKKEGEEYKQIILTPDENKIPLEILDLKGTAGDGVLTAFEEAALRTQKSLNILTGPLMGALYIKNHPENEERILIVVHHLVVDVVSWSIVVADFKGILNQLTQGAEISLPRKSTSYAHWAGRLVEYAGASKELEESWSYWANDSFETPRQIPVDFDDGENLNGSVNIVRAFLEQEKTRALLTEVPRAYKTQINDLLLLALSVSLAEWIGEGEFAVELEGHGREEIFDDVDISRTVGWFTSVYPFRLERANQEDIGESLMSLKEKIRAVPRKGMNYGILRYLGGHTKGSLSPELSFNYLGQLEGTGLDDEKAMQSRRRVPEVGPGNQRPYLIDITGGLLGGRLVINFLYSENVHNRATIEKLSESYMAALGRVIEYCLRPETGGITPSDFPLAPLTRKELKELPYEPSAIENIYSLAPAQKGILFHSIDSQDGDDYYIRVEFKLRGALDLTAFQQAWQGVIDRHEILRTSFVWDNLQEPLQVVHPRIELPFETLDWRKLNEAEIEANYINLQEEDRLLGYDLAKAPLMRVKVIQLVDELFQVFWSHNHIILDGWSLPQILEESLRIYGSIVEKTNHGLKRTQPYSSFIEYLQGTDKEAARNFWREYLRGFETPLRLGAVARSGAAKVSFKYGSLKYHFGSDLTGNLAVFAKKHKMTPNVVLQGALALTLSRYAAQRDVVLGTVTSGRPAELDGVETIVGLFINTLPLRVQVDSNASLLDWLLRLQDNILELRQYETTPLADIQHVSDLSPAESLFDVIFAYENYPMSGGGEEEEKPLILEDLDGLQFTNFALSMTAVPLADMHVLAEFDQNRFKPEFIEQFLGHMKSTLENIMNRVEVELSRLPFLNLEEEAKLKFSYNRTEREYPAERPVHVLFESFAASNPKEEAVRWSSGSLSYEELNNRANQLAHYLRKAGVGLETPVGICMVRSPEMLAGILGILKAGGTYVPLDPDYPEERLSYMVGDAGIFHVVSTRKFQQKVHLENVRLILTDRDKGDITEESDANLEPVSTGENLAYIMYTSGSTGLPKGTSVLHKAVNRLVCNPGFVEYDGKDRVAHMASVSFDAATFEIWGAFANGGLLIIYDKELVLTTQEFGEALGRDRITHIFLTSALFNQMVKLSPGFCANLGFVLVGGEAVSPESARQVLAAGAPRKLLNGYGPTENTTFSVCHLIADVSPDSGSVPIGRPIGNSTAYVLDQNFDLLPMGVPGTLYVGGDGLARHYHNRPALTAEKFIPNPFSETPGARLYNTGDLAYWTEEGVLECLGRLDDQVKIRGFRIETGEIEAVLERHPELSRAAVTVREDEPGVKRLVAYVIKGEPSQVTKDEIRSYLGETLPDYMIPSVFVTLPEFPLTANGKLDRRALPAPDRSVGEYIAPRTREEQILAAVWEDVLKVERVGLSDNFFELGGDSILSIQIMSRAGAQGIHLTTKQIFKHQNIASLAAAAEERRIVGAEGPVTGESLLTPVQKWFFKQELTEPNYFNQSSLLELPVELEAKIVEETLRILAGHHDMLRARYKKEGKDTKQVILTPEEVHFNLTSIDVANLTEDNAREIYEQAARELHQSLDIEKGPIFGALFVQRKTEAGNQILLVIHHLVVDGVSWRILLSDFQDVSRQLLSGETVKTVPRTTSFPFWSNRLLEYGGTREELPTSLNPAKNQAWLDSNSLKRDFPEGENTVASIDVVSARLTADETEKLLKRVPAAYNNRINDVLLAALSIAWSRWDTGTGVAVHLESHGRAELFDDIELSNTVGWFTSIYPVFLERADENLLAELLPRVKETLRGIPHEGIEYGLWRYGRGQGESIPGAEISVNYLGQMQDGGLGETSSREAMQAVPEVSPRNNRAHLLDVLGGVWDGCLSVSWLFSENIHKRESIETLSEYFQDALRAIIKHCLLPESGGFTPSDFPLTGLDQKSLDVLGLHPTQISDLYPLSPTQNGILYHSVFSRSEGDYYIRAGFKMKGVLDSQAFQQAWDGLVERYDILRTSFLWENLKEPLQLVHKEARVPFSFIDMANLSDADREQNFKELEEADAEKGFDLKTPPIMRVTVVRIADREYDVIWSHNHILLDGWSLPLLVDDLFRLYGELCEGTRSELPPVPAYKDFIEYLSSIDPTEAEEYWKKYLSGFESPVEIGYKSQTGQSGESAKGYAYDLRKVDIEPALGEALQEFSREHRLTPNVIVQGALFLLMGRYSGRDDIVLGAVTSGRPAHLENVERMVGLLINTLPLRVRIEPGASVLTWLGSLQENLLQMRQFETTPLIDVQNWSDLPQGTPLFDVIFAYENYPMTGDERQELLPLELDDFGAEQHTSYPLHISVIAGSAADDYIQAEFNGYLFSTDFVKQILEHLLKLLDGILKNPEVRLSEIPIMSPEENRDLLESVNQTKTETVSGEFIHELFVTQARKTPDALAVVFEDRKLTYRELDEKSNSLAEAILAQVRVDSFVGVGVERTENLPICLLAVLKAGCSYVPLDPGFPEERLRMIVEDSGISLIVSEKDMTVSFDNYGCEILYVDSENPTLGGMKTELPEFGDNKHPAYAMFTSGSTGRPKGVVISHRGVINFLNSMGKTPGLAASDVLLAVTTIAFDISVLEIFLPLLAGATLVICDRRKVADGLYLIELLKESKTTIMQATPATWKLLIDSGWKGNGELKMLCGGEALPFSLAEELLQRGKELWNMYGPTETTIWSSVAVLSVKDPIISIGAPIDNTQFYIIDKHYNPVPRGAIGELFIGGEGLAQGYLNAPDITAEKFIPDHLAGEPGGRLYRTGDLARWSLNGMLEYIGRADNQVKIRGFRIEMGEIETRLNEQEKVTEAVVIVREDVPGDKQLVAYIVSENKLELDPGYLRDFLGQTLPHYMIPGTFVFLEEFPLTLNGKINRRALPAPAKAVQAEFLAPISELEKSLANIWQDVFETERIGLTDNFFELGGHSLTATRIMTRVWSDFNREISVQKLFEYPVLADLVREIEKELSLDAPAPRQEISLADRDGFLPLSFAQQRLWFIDKIEPNNPAYNIPLAVRIRGKVEPASLERDINKIIKRQESLRTVVDQKDGEPFQNILSEVNLKLEVKDFTELQDEAVLKQAIIEEVGAPFDLAVWPLIRCVLYQEGTDNFVLVITMHHIISDGWSTGVFLKELTALQQVALEGGELSPLKIQYADFALWQRNWLQGEELERQMDYWKDIFQGELPVLELPTDTPRGKLQSFRGSLETLNVSGEVTEKLRAVAGRSGGTLFMVLLAAFNLLLSRYSGQEDVIIGTPVANRSRKELETLVGLFVNTLALRTDLSGNPDFMGLLARVRESVLGLHKHSELPYERLINELNIERDLSRNPLFQAMFTLQNAPGTERRADGVEIEAFPFDWNFTNFDLTLNLTETEVGLEGFINYNSDIFNAGTIKRFCESLVLMLGALAENSEMKLSDVPLVTEAENHQQLREWNNTASEIPACSGIHALVETQVQKTPDALCLIVGESRLTYRELDQRANQAAHFIKSRIQPGELVGVGLTRSVDMITALLAVLKAGGAYVPLDPEFPPERLGLIVEDSGVNLIMAERETKAIFEGFSGEFVILEDISEELGGLSREAPPEISGNTESPAYVMFTSGSTGRPKGVVVPHRSVINFLLSMEKSPGLRSGDSLLAVTTISFDISVLEIFLPLISGATVVLANSKQVVDGGALIELLQGNGVNTMQATPATWQLLIDSGWEGDGKLKMLCGGEALPAPLADELVERGGELWNVYGPTETTIWSTLDRVSKGSARVSIGRPIDNTEIYILDQHLNPVPPGAAGELCIGGQGLALGYWKAPYLTADKFIPDSFSNVIGAKLYRTGDQARWNQDGRLEYLGRIDNQIKLRGFRIEPGEIETILREHSEVHQSLVVVREDEPGLKRLVAYLIKEDKSQSDVEGIREYLKAKLPDYMVPAAFVILKEYPLTANGKINRRGLPAPEIRSDVAFVAPRNELEEKLTTIWRDLLKVEKVGVNDNFFQLGGHSLLIVKLFAQVEKILAEGQELKVVDMFRYPTVGVLANFILEGKRDELDKDELDQRAQKSKARRGKRKKVVLDM